jgi:hypothetical protein
MTFSHLCCKNGIAASMLLILSLIQNKQWSVSAIGTVMNTEMIQNLPGMEDMSAHLRKLSESSHMSLLAGTATATGYFYAEYSNTLSCDGPVNYVEGYATGVCLPKMDMTSGVQVGSIIQTCSNMGRRCLVYVYMSMLTCL